MTATQDIQSANDQRSGHSLQRVVRRRGPRRLNGVAWAIERWSRVTQKQKTRLQVKAAVLKVGWLYFEMEMKYWGEQAKLPGKRKHAPHPGWPPPNKD